MKEARRDISLTRQAEESYRREAALARQEAAAAGQNREASQDTIGTKEIKRMQHKLKAARRRVRELEKLAKSREKPPSGTSTTGEA